MFYEVSHGLKDSRLSDVRDRVVQSVSVDSDHVVLIQLHLASVLKSSGYGVMLKQDMISSLLKGPVAYYRPLLLNNFCHFSGARCVANGPGAITSVQAYDPAEHIFKMSVMGSQCIVAVLGNSCPAALYVFNH